VIENINVINSTKKAKEILESYGYICDVSAEDLVKYFQTDTFYDDLSLDEVLQNQLLVIHEIVEIDEIKRMGLKITKDVIIKNYEKICEAHLKAAEIELEIAKDIGDYEHIKNRLRNIKDWCEDPLEPPQFKNRCEELCIKTKQSLNNINRGEKNTK
jgi:hypothetical protein